MKTKNFAIMISTILISVFSLSAQAVNTSSVTILDDVIKSVFKYPAEAKSEGITGFVIVEVQMDNDGRINVKQINSDNEMLKNYVISQLNNIKIPNAAIGADEVRIYKFKFKLI